MVDAGKGSLGIDFASHGAAGASWLVTSADSSPGGPVDYTSAPAGDSLDRAWDVAGARRARYDFTVYGPNGFLRGFKGDLAPPARRFRPPRRQASESAWCCNTAPARSS